jgi:hypothetical protein
MDGQTRVAPVEQIANEIAISSHRGELIHQARTPHAHRYANLVMMQDRCIDIDLELSLVSSRVLLWLRRCSHGRKRGSGGL